MQCVLQTQKLGSLAAWAGDLGDEDFLARAAALKSVGEEVLQEARQYLKQCMRAIVATSKMNEEDFQVGERVKDSTSLHYGSFQSSAQLG
jgi:hypothetical protein